MKVTILMPSLNEEKAVSRTISDIPLEKLDRMGLEVEILLVDGKSSDGTVDAAKSSGARVINSERGYGRQYIAGFKEAKGEIIVTADSDNSYPMNDIPRLVKILQDENLDFISTNRFAGLEKSSMRLVNNFGNKWLTFLTNLLFSIDIKDSQSGMWIFKRDILKRIVIKSTGMSLSQEIKIEAFKKLHSKEVDSSYKKRLGSAKLRIIKDGIGNTIHLIKKAGLFQW